MNHAETNNALSEPTPAGASGHRSRDGLMIALLGPDGSGKSSVIQGLTARLTPVFGTVRCFHLRPRVGSAALAGNQTNTNPHGQAPRGWLSSLLKLAFLFLDYHLGYLFSVRPLIASGNLVIFDRYYADLLIDPRRYRFAGPMRLAHLVHRLIPKPKLWILLDAPAEVLQARKREVSFEECSRQRQAYRAFVSRLNNGMILDASQPLENVITEAMEIILARSTLPSSSNARQR